MISAGDPSVVTNANTGSLDLGVNNPSGIPFNSSGSGSVIGADSDSGIGAAMNASLVLSTSQIVFGTISAYFGHQMQSILMKADRESKMSALGHQDKMAGIQKDAQLYQLSSQEKKIEFQQDHNKEYLESAKTRKQAEDEVAVAQAQVKEKKAYEKSMKNYDAKVNAKFGRSTYSYG